ncbi:MAG: GntR family transcriptional regulator [Oscillospiraceae bacterium]|nr:GntR family transcriptional regulator [Oscillospiraceae bacterium]
MAEKCVLYLTIYKGTYVFPGSPLAEFSAYLDFDAYCKKLGKAASTRLLDFQVFEAQEPHYRFLLRGTEGRVVEITRLRLADGVPVIREVSVFSERYLPLLRGIGEGSLYRLLYRNSVHPAFARKRFSVRLADTILSEQMGVPLGKSLLYISDKVYDEEKAPLHLNEQWVICDNFDIVIDLAK